MMSEEIRSGTPSPGAAPLKVAAGVAAFLLLQYVLALWKLGQSSGGMLNKFSALAREKYLGFLVMQNLWMLVAYVLLGIGMWLLTWPVVDAWTRHSKRNGHAIVMLRGFVVVAALHGFCMLRLAQTRPYFLNEAEFGHWYYRLIEFPEPVRPAALFILFTLLPVLYIGYVMIWHLRRLGRRKWWVTASVLALTATAFAMRGTPNGPSATAGRERQAPNVIIIGSDSLRGDRLGYMGHRPERDDGPAAAGVSPVIDKLAARSAIFERCYTSIASTLESGVQLMASQYPHTFGIRQMYPDRATVEVAKKRVVPFPKLLRERGYDTTAIGDWCAGYYEIMPLGFEHVSVSSFDNFRIYMSQAVVMEHFIVPLYFDNALGYCLFPQIESFAQFVTPGVVTERVERRLADVARKGKPFFWHVFYSCNHLPFRSKEPYAGMFADPAYKGPNKNGVDFDIDSFIGGTDLESKWKALPEDEIRQIRTLYDGCTRQFDDCVAGILAALKRNGLEENTIVIVTADHGDDLYEPGVTLGHGLTFNGGLHANHVPLVMHVPGTAPKVIPETVRLIDVIPTLAELLDVEPSPTWEGKSFAPWLRGVEPPRHRAFYGETGFPFIQFRVAGIERPPLPPMDEMTRIDEDYNYQFVLRNEYGARLVEAKQRCLRSRDWKLVCTPTADGGRHFGLFHLASDPHGEKDLAAARPEVLAPMRAALERWLDAKIETPLEEIFPGGEP